MPLWRVRWLLVVALSWATPLLVPPGAAAGRVSLSALEGVARGQELSAALEQTLPRTDQGRELDDVVREVKSAAAAGQRPVVVFDIDDTLIRWRKLGGQKVSYTEMPGALDYVHALTDAGARIVYLTARPERLRRQTQALLRRMGLPLSQDHALMMRRPGQSSFVRSKERARPRILALGRPVALFDNDLANVRLFRGQYPDARVFRVVGHSGSSDPHPELGRDGIRVVSDLAGAGRELPARVGGGRARGPRRMRGPTVPERSLRTRATRARAQCAVDRGRRRAHAAGDRPERLSPCARGRSAGPAPSRS